MKKLTLSRAEISKLKTAVTNLKREKKDILERVKSMAVAGSAEAQAIIEEMEEDGSDGNKK